MLPTQSGHLRTAESEARVPRRLRHSVSVRIHVLPQHAIVTVTEVTPVTLQEEYYVGARSGLRVNENGLV